MAMVFSDKAASIPAMGEILEKIYYGNTLGTWILAVAIVIAAVVGGKILYLVLGKYVKKLTEKTKTRLDDIIIDMIEEPIVMTVVLIGIWYAVGLLTFGDNLQMWIGRAFYAA